MRRSARGFTLVETLMACLCLCLICSMILAFVQVDIVAVQETMGQNMRDPDYGTTYKNLFVAMLVT